MSQNPIPEAERQRFAELLASLTDQINRLPADATNAELSQCLRTTVATLVLQGNLLCRILEAQAGTLNQLGQRLDQIQSTLNQLVTWAKEQPGQSGDDSAADWWKK
jgi:hypothetical protein